MSFMYIKYSGYCRIEMEYNINLIYTYVTIYVIFLIVDEKLEHGITIQCHTEQVRRMRKIHTAANNCPKSNK